MKFLMMNLPLVLLLAACTSSPTATLQEEDKPSLSHEEIVTLRLNVVSALYSLIRSTEYGSFDGVIGQNQEFVGDFLVHGENFEELDAIVRFFWSSRFSDYDHSEYGSLGYVFQIKDLLIAVEASRGATGDDFTMQLKVANDQRKKPEESLLIFDQETLENQVVISSDSRSFIRFSDEWDKFSQSPFEAVRQINHKKRRSRLIIKASGIGLIVGAASMGSAISGAVTGRLSNHAGEALFSLGSFIVAASAIGLSLSVAQVTNASDFYGGFTIRDPESGERTTLEYETLIARLKDLSPTLKGQNFRNLVAEDGKTMKNPFIEIYLLHLEDLLGPLGFARHDMFSRRYRSEEFVNAFCYVVGSYREIDVADYHNSEFTYYPELESLLKILGKGEYDGQNEPLYDPSW